MTHVEGFRDERFAGFEVMLRTNLDSGLDEGASVAVFVDGEPVVDLWGGWLDQTHAQPWAEDTIVPVYSTAKVLVIVAVLILWDRGLLDLDAPIADHWPDFGGNGKSAITPRHVLTHRSGLPCFGQQLSLAEMADWEHVIRVLERAPLVHRPGCGKLLPREHLRVHSR